MSALCCAAPSMATGSSLPVYQFSRPSMTQNYSFMPMELNGYGSSRIHQQQQLPYYADHQSSTYGSQQQQQQQFVMPQHQSSASRRKRLALQDALTSAIPAASSGKVSQRIAQLQQSLYASCHSVAGQAPGIIHPLASSSRPLSLDPAKDYSLPLTVDCSIEYDLPRVARPPPGSKPLLLIARRPALPAVNHPVRDTRQNSNNNWNCNPTSHLQSSQQQQQQFIDCGGYFVMMNVASSGSEDSGRGTDSERAPSPIVPSQPNWMTISDQQSGWIRSRQSKLNHHVVKPGLSAIPQQHPRPAG